MQMESDHRPTRDAEEQRIAPDLFITTNFLGTSWTDSVHLAHQSQANCVSRVPCQDRSLWAHLSIATQN